MFYLLNKFCYEVDKDNFDEGFCSIHEYLERKYLENKYFKIEHNNNLIEIENEIVNEREKENNNYRWNLEVEI